MDIRNGARILLVLTFLDGGLLFKHRTQHQLKNHLTLARFGLLPPGLLNSVTLVALLAQNSQMTRNEY
jgi:hypothetical protein